MGLLQQYDPPGCLSDFDGIPGQREAWHTYVQSIFVNVAGKLAEQRTSPNSSAVVSQAFYAASRLDPGAVIERDIVWNAFPGELTRRFGRERALREADRRWPLSSSLQDWRFDPDVPAPGASAPRDEPAFRPCTEYCEWHVDRCEHTGAIRRVTFTTEAPEYWQALSGGPAPNSNVICPGDRSLLLTLYRKLVDPRVELEDLLVKKPFRTAFHSFQRGDYNPYNRWNIERGIAHLTAPPNTLTAEILLAAHATACFHDATGEPVRRAEAIVAGAALGSANRNSDVSIVGCVNALARQGHRLTLANPVGIYMDHVDLAGWEVPDRIAPEECLRIVRGGGRQVTRLVLEVPSPKFNLSDVRIGGVPLTCGGQIAECITVRLRAVASVATDLLPSFQPLVTAGRVDPAGGTWVFQSGPVDFPPGTVPAFRHEPDAHARPQWPLGVHALATRALQ